MTTGGTGVLRRCRADGFEPRIDLGGAKDNRAVAEAGVGLGGSGWVLSG